MNYRVILMTLLCAVTLQAADFASPVLLTSGGQSADAQMLKTLLTREAIPFTFEALATSANLEGNKSVIIVLGGSSKGLGAAKVSSEQETARITELLSTAAKQGIPVFAVHVGGKNRRGALSDEFNQLGAQHANRLVVVSGGDDDGFFSKIAESQNLEFQTVEKITDLGPMLKATFGSTERDGE
ncbi:MAG: hypothetical protein H6508_07160 [Calditrichaeota bacterium]|nr:hypothetical protein [Calditrichota bacterium]MCB9366938.1 hypothetical protein [Calditrichota bacterium]